MPVAVLNSVSFFGILDSGILSQNRRNFGRLPFYSPTSYSPESSIIVLILVIFAIYPGSLGEMKKLEFLWANGFLLFDRDP